MKQIDHGILIQRKSFSETSLIVTVLTRHHGLTTFLFQGGKKKKGNVLFPMAQIELTYFHRGDSSMPKLSEVSLLNVNQTIPFNPVKSGIAFFMAEMIYNLVKPGHREEELFSTLQNELHWLEATDELTNYPIWFLAEMCHQSGISPSIETENPTVFDMLGSKLTTVRPLNANHVEGDWVHWIESALYTDSSTFLAMKIPRDDRTACFDALMIYIKVHITGSKVFSSADIVREVLSA